MKLSITAAEKWFNKDDDQTVYRRLKACSSEYQQAQISYQSKLFTDKAALDHSGAGTYNRGTSLASKWKHLQYSEEGFMLNHFCPVSILFILYVNICSYSERQDIIKAEKHTLFDTGFLSRFFFM